MKGCAVSLTGDPITAGHRDIIKRAYEMFGRVVVFLAGNSAKKGALLGYDDRKKLVELALAEDGVHDFEVLPISGAVVDCAKKAGVNVIVRGLRNEQDLVYETDMSAVNRMLAPGVETVYLPCRPELSYVSSSAVRELACLGKFEAAAKFSSVDAAMLLKRRLTKTVALTGGIACGKSVAQKVFEKRGWLGIDCDELNRELLSDPVYCHQLDAACYKKCGVKLTWSEIKLGQFILDKKELAKAVFGSPSLKKVVEEVAFPAIAEKLDKKLSYYSRGQPLRAVIQAPLLFDQNAEPFPFKFDKTICIASFRQMERMTQIRGYSDEEARARLESQSPLCYKRGRCDYTIDNDGTLAEFEAAVDELAAELERTL